MSHSTLLNRIKKEFGSREDVIEGAFTSSESFRALCRDYFVCLRALAGFQKLDSKEARLREGEYSELLQELAVEIEARLNAVGSVPTCRSIGRRGSEEGHRNEGQKRSSHED